MHIQNFNVCTRDDITRSEAPIYFSLLDQPTCYSATHENPPLIIDTGASVCISPTKSDFITYQPSTMRIKDLSSSNTVAGEGLISWHVLDTKGKQVTVTLQGYHIPTAEVQLLSPQLLLTNAGGYAHQTSTKIRVHLDSGETMDAHYCSRTRLPTLQLVNGTPATQSFYTSTFDFA